MPPESSATHHLVAHLSLLHGHTGIAQGCRLHAQSVASLVGRPIFIKVHMEGGALILLCAYALRVLVGLYGELSCQPRLRQCKVHGSYAVCIGGSLLLGYHLVVGITQRKLQHLVGTHLLLYPVLHLINQCRGMHRLPWSVDAAIRKDSRLLYGAFSLIELISARSAQHGSRLILIRIGKGTARARHILGIKKVFSLCIRGALVGLLVIVAHLLFYSQVGPCHGLSGGGVHHHVAYLAVRLRLSYGVQVGHVVQRPQRLCGGVRRYLYQIHACGQSCQRHRVDKLLVGRLRCKRLRLVNHGGAQQRFYLLVALTARWVHIYIALAVHGVHLHAQCLQVTQPLQPHLLCLHRAHHLQVVFQSECRVYQLLLLVTQIIHGGPFAPLLHGLVDKGYACRVAGAVWQSAITFHRQFSIQYAHRLLVASLCIIVAHLLIVAQLAPYHAQHVVIKHGGIHAHHHKGFKTLLFGLGQQLTERRCQFGFLKVQPHASLVVSYLVEHRLVHQSQHLVLRVVISRYDAVQRRHQRVGRYGRHRLCPHQFCLQQVSVLFLLLSLLYYLLQHLILCLWQIFLFSLLSLLPKTRI